MNANLRKTVDALVQKNEQERKQAKLKVEEQQMRMWDGIRNEFQSQKEEIEAELKRMKVWVQDALDGKEMKRTSLDDSPRDGRNRMASQFNR